MWIKVTGTLREYIHIFITTLVANVTMVTNIQWIFWLPMLLRLETFLWIQRLPVLITFCSCAVCHKHFTLVGISSPFFFAPPVFFFLFAHAELIAAGIHMQGQHNILLHLFRICNRRCMNMKFPNFVSAARSAWQVI
jgi:hypothetical protein